MTHGLTTLLYEITRTRCEHPSSQLRESCSVCNRSQSDQFNVTFRVEREPLLQPDLLSL